MGGGVNADRECYQPGEDDSNRAYYRVSCESNQGDIVDPIIFRQPDIITEAGCTGTFYAAGGYTPDSSVCPSVEFTEFACVSVDEDYSQALSCPLNYEITEVLFDNYGNTFGSCPTYIEDTECSCNINSHNDWIGENTILIQSYDGVENCSNPCDGTMKRTVAVKCEPISALNLTTTCESF